MQQLRSDLEAIAKRLKTDCVTIPWCFRFAFAAIAQ
jgi:hypothetical protein